LGDLIPEFAVIRDYGGTTVYPTISNKPESIYYPTSPYHQTETLTSNPSVPFWYWPLVIVILLSILFFGGKLIYSLVQLKHQNQIELQLEKR
jgi:hypothetical protein